MSYAVVGGLVIITMGHEDRSDCQRVRRQREVACIIRMLPAAAGTCSHAASKVQLMVCAQRMLWCVCAAALQYIERMKIDILENLRHLAAAPGVQFDEVRIRVARCYGSSSTPS